MIERMAELPDHVVGFTAIGKVTGEDYESVLIPAVEAGLERHAHLNLLYHIGPDFDGFDAGAVWNDTKVGLKHLTAWKRVAVVTDVDWIRGAARAFGFVMPCHVRVFENVGLGEARIWVAEEIPD